MGMLTSVKNADGTYSTIHLSDKALDRIAAAIGVELKREPCSCGLFDKTYLYPAGTAAKVSAVAQEETKKLLEKLSAAAQQNQSEGPAAQTNLISSATAWTDGPRSAPAGPQDTMQGCSQVRRPPPRVLPNLSEGGKMREGGHRIEGGWPWVSWYSTGEPNEGGWIIFGLDAIRKSEPNAEE